MSHINDFKLVYAYLPKYNIEGNNSTSVVDFEEIRFGSEYEFKYNVEINELVAFKNDIYVRDYFCDNFFDECIGKPEKSELQISTLIGKNGSGKTLCLEALIENMIYLTEVIEKNKSLFINQRQDLYIVYCNDSIKLNSTNLQNGDSTLIDRDRVIIKKSLIDLKADLSNLYIAYYTPQLSYRKVSSRASSFNFYNHSFSYRLDKSISPINLDINNRNRKLEGAHLHGSYDNFEVTFSRFFHSKNVLDQITSIFSLEKMTSLDIERSKYAGEIIEDLKSQIPRSICITSDFIEYFSSDYKIGMVNRSDILSCYDEDSTALEKSIYKFIKDQFLMGSSNNDLPNSILATYIYRILDAMFKDIFRNYNYAQIEREFKDYLNKFVDMKSFFTPTNDESNIFKIPNIEFLTIVFDILNDIIQQWDFKPKNNSIHMEVITNICSRIIDSYRNLFVEVCRLINCMKLKYSFESDIDKLKVNKRLVLVNQSVRVDGMVTIKEKEIECIDIKYDLTNENSEVFIALGNLINAINDLYSWKMPIKIKWNYELSAGEYHKLSLLTMMSSVNEYIRRESINNKTPVNTLLLLMDEPDTFMHPEWERQLINDLVNMVRIYFNDIHIVQVIISTNKPIILTDLPHYNVNYIGYKDGDIEERRTFYSDIHDLYRQNFVVKRSVGEFAVNKLSYLSDKLENDRVLISEEDLKLIELIGDEVTRKKMQMKYDNWLKESVKDRTKELANKLRSDLSKEEIQKFIELLKDAQE